MPCEITKNKAEVLENEMEVRGKNISTVEFAFLVTMDDSIHEDGRKQSQSRMPSDMLAS